jgi:hypothetical protein
MKKKRIEAGIRALQFAGAEQDIAPFSDMKEQVLKACSLRQNDNGQESQRAKRKAGLRLAIRAALAAACVLLVVSVYSAIAPIPKSNANGFMRQVQIWAGGVLKTNALVAPPEKKGALPETMPGGGKDMQTLKEAHEAFGLTVLAPSQLPAGMTLGEVKTSGPDELLSSIQYSYGNQIDTLDFEITEIADQGGTAIFVETIDRPTPVGTFTVWGGDTGWNALAVCGSSQVTIRGTLDKETFLKILDGLREVN